MLYVDVFSKKLIILSASILLLLLHLYWSITKNDFNWLGAYGAILTVISLVVLFIRTNVPEMREELTDLVSINRCGHVQYGSEILLMDLEDVARLNRDKKREIIKKYYPIIMAYLLSITGTLIWAYSGLLLNQPSCSC